MASISALVVSGTPNHLAIVAIHGVTDVVVKKLTRSEARMIQAIAFSARCGKRAVVAVGRIPTRGTAPQVVSGLIQTEVPAAAADTLWFMP